MENSAQEKKNNAGFILTNICNKMKIFSQLYWNLLRHLVIAAWWRLLRRELKGPDKTREGGLCILFIQGLSPESVRHSVLWAELKCWNSNIKTLLLLHLLNPAISTLILARAVEDVMSVLKLNTKQRLYRLSSTSRHGQEQGVCCHRRHVWLFTLICICSTLQWSQSEAFPVAWLAFKFEYRQAGSQFMNWLCPPLSSSPWNQWETLHRVEGKLD